ncbi:hypothetical protein Tco_1235976 [Tanacetum coccineum]
MADDQPMWGNNQAVAPTLAAAIIPVELGDNFKVKGHHLSMIKDRQFDGRTRATPHKHIAEFIKIYGMFRYDNTNVNSIKLKLFLSSLSGEAKVWYNELSPGSKDIKAIPIRKTVAFAEGSDNSMLMEKMEALTTKIDSQFKEIKGEMKDPKKKLTMSTEDIEETTMVEILEIGATANHETAMKPHNPMMTITQSTDAQEETRGNQIQKNNERIHSRSMKNIYVIFDLCKNKRYSGLD